MKIKEVLPILGNMTKVHLSYDGMAIDFFPDNPLMMEAYGDFIVKAVFPFDATEESVTYEIQVASKPFKGGD